MAAAVVCVLLSPAAPGARQVSGGQRVPTFRGGVETIYVNVIVRDKDGKTIRGLTRNDFQLVEDGKPQTIDAFDFEEVPSEPRPAGAPESPAEPVQPILKATPATTAAHAEPTATRPIDLRDRRLIVLLFDSTSMQPEEIERAAASARDYLNTRLTPADLVAVASVGTSLQVVQDFTADRESLLHAIDRFTGADTAGFEEGTVPAEDTTEDEGFVPDETEFNIFNADRRLQAIETLSQALAPIQQKKSILYFSSGMTRTGEDNQVELRNAIDRAVKANVSIYPVDTRGLTAVVPGGEARQESRGGVGMFSGRGTAQQFDRQASSQETLVTLASDTGGRAFLDTNDFGTAYNKVIADTSAYYILGYSTTNPARDGRFRRIKVRVTRPGLKVEHRNGYYAPKDFARANKQDREWELQEQLLTDISSTDLTVWLDTSYFREGNDRYYVPVSIAVPGSEIPFVRSSAADTASIDIIGLVRDGQQRPVGRLRDTVKLAVQPSQEVRRKTVQYQTAFTLPSGTFKLKVVLRENQSGAIGSFETDLVVPDLRKAAVKLSSVVLGTQTQPASSKDRGNPLARNGTLLVPSLTHVVSTKQPIYFYYELYDPAATQGQAPRLLTSIAFFRGRVRTYQTPLVEVDRLAASDRKAAVFQFSVPASALKPGFYTCQVTVVDDVAGTFAFPRLPLLVR